MSQGWVVENFGFVLLRTSTLPYDSLLEWCGGNGDTAYDASDDFVNSSRHKIDSALELDIFRHAIYYAAPSLYENLKKYSSKSDDKKNLKLSCALYKYLSRMSCRATPFGLFAATSYVELANSSKLAVEEELHTRVNLDALIIKRALNELISFWLNTLDDSVFLRVNNTLYSLGDQYRYTKNVDEAGSGKHKFIRINATEEIKSAIDLSKEWIRPSKLMTELILSINCSAEEARLFIRNLVKSQIIETNLNISITSGGGHGYIFDGDRHIGDPSPIEKIKQMMQLFNDVARGDYLKINSATSDIEVIMQNAFGKQKNKNSLYINSFRDGLDSTLSLKEIEYLSIAMSELLPAMWDFDDDLKDFTKRFYERYEDQEIPLLEALDVDSGISLGLRLSNESPLLRGGVTQNFVAHREISWSNWNEMILSKIIDSINHDKNPIAITSEDIKYARPIEFNGKIKKTITVHATRIISHENSNQISYVLKGIAGPSSLASMARFGVGHQKIQDGLDLISEYESNTTNDLIAEIVYAPPSRAMNLSLRNKLSATEIIYGCGTSSNPDVMEITCCDLTLRCESGRLKIRSRSLNRDICPRLSSAHVTSGLNPPVYNFLNKMQYAYGRPKSLISDSIIPGIRFIPRITFKNVVLNLATWIINLKDFPEGRASSDHLLGLHICNYLIKHRVPRFCSLHSGDNFFHIDIRDDLCIKILVAELKSSRTLSIKECVDSLGAANISSEIKSRAFSHEFLIPLKVSLDCSDYPGFNSKQSYKPLTDLSRTEKLFAPLEKWVYLKLFSGVMTIESILVNNLRPFLDFKISEGVIEKWFFIRYGSRDFTHIRLRLLPTLGVSAELVYNELIRVIKPLINERLISKVEVCGYSPEYARYGGPLGMETSETIFFSHSVLISDFIRRIHLMHGKENLLWQYAFAHVWRVLGKILDDIEDIFDFASKVRDMYRIEMHSNGSNKASVSGNYRLHEPVINALLEAKRGENWLDTNVDLVRLSHANLRKLKQTYRGDALMGIIQSIIHVDCVRIFPFNPRANEMIIYDYISRHAKKLIFKVKSVS